jgi:hypothetical protein
MKDEGGAPGGEAALQFDKVELAPADAAVACRSCQRGIAGEYFEVAGNIVCPACAEQLGAAKGWGAFVRAVGFGAGAALLGTLAWLGVIKLTGGEFGLLAIGVGFLVGAAVRKGARGPGGWKYQSLAIALTYVSITASYVPLLIRQMGEGDATEDRALGSEAAGVAAPRDVSIEAAPAAAGRAWSFTVLVVLFGVAFVSPFLSGTQNIMGILIIGIALYEAWKLNKRVPISGPFRLGTS